MLFGGPPTPTRYDLRFTLASIPVQVHPLFWLMAVLFGASAGGILQLLVWVAVVFVSILFHELGHALAFRFYGQPSRIVLYMAGGMTVPEPIWWGSRWANVSLGSNQEILISLAGPCAGFLLAGLVVAGVVVTGGSVQMASLYGVIPWVIVLPATESWIVNSIVMTLLWVNLFWGLVNLMPVFPLDGGNIARHLFIKADPLNGIRKSLWLSVVTGAVVAALGLIFMRSVYIALLFGLLAFQSYQILDGRAGGWPS